MDIKARRGRDTNADRRDFETNNRRFKLFHLDQMLRA